MSNYIERLPTAQKRCSGHKKYVFVDEDFVYKGPYAAGEVALKRAVTRPHIIDQLQTAMKIPESDKTSLIPSKQIEIGNKIYLQFCNIGDAPLKTDVETVSTKIDQNIQVFKRETFVDRISEIEKRRALTDKEISIILQHLYTIYLLNVGDAGTHNMLACRRGSQMLVGVDYEENRGLQQSHKAETDIFACLFKSSGSKLQKQIYKQHLKGIEQIDLGMDFALVMKNNLSEVNIDQIKKNAATFAKLLANIDLIRETNFAANFQ